MSFSIESDKYVAMKEKFEEVADIIKRAINSERPIIIRHHGDVDGVSAGLSLENACRQLMIKALVKPHFKLFRFSCRAPYYDFTDFVKDLNTIKRANSRDKKKPLIIIMDNGSTEEDLFGIKCLHDVGLEVIVVDHHKPVEVSPGVSENCKYLLAHINTHLFGFGSDLCAGMLSFELANHLVPMTNFSIPAVSAIDDRIEGAETDKYIELSKKPRGELEDIGSALDYLLFGTKFDVDSSVYEELFFNPELVKGIIEKVSVLEKEKLLSVKESLTDEMIGSVRFLTVDIEKYSERFVYPRTGKITELVLDEAGDAFVCSLVGSAITIRQSRTFISTSDLIKSLKAKMPLANIKGGGHANAGTISFISAYSEKVLENIKEIVANIQ